MILFILLIYYLPTASASSDTESDTKFADSVYSLGVEFIVYSSVSILSPVPELGVQ